MSIGFLYSGQGSQEPGMGKDFYEKYNSFKEFYDSIELDFDLKEFSFEKPEEVIKETQYTQPLMIAFQNGITRLLKEKGIEPAGVSGLSIGEYAAVAAAGILDPKEVVELAAFRGKRMAEASQDMDAAMVAVLGLEEGVVREVCEEVSEGDERAEISNLNCPKQIVVSGEKSAVEKAGEILKEKGARKIIPLKVSGPFHTTYMEKVSHELREKFKTLSFKEEQIPVYYNATGQKKDGEEIQDLLADQVKTSVRFEDDLRTMIDDGVDTFIEIGYGGVLKGFLKRINRKLPCYEIFSVETFEETVRSIKNDR